MKGINFNRSSLNKFFTFLVFVEISLLVIHLILKIALSDQLSIERFDMDQEVSVPTWFSAIQLFFISFIGFIVYKQLKIENPKISSLFIYFSILFLFLSMDEVAEIHESLTRLLSPFEWIPRFKGDHGVWIYLYLTGFMAFLVFISKRIVLLWKTFTKEVNIIVVGGIIFLMGAVVLEILSYQYLEGNDVKTLYNVEVGFEEFFEMFGATIILYGTLLTCLKLSYTESNLKGIDPKYDENIALHK